MSRMLDKPLIVCGFQKSGNTWVNYILSYYYNARYYDPHFEESKLSGASFPPKYEEHFVHNKIGFQGNHDRPNQDRQFTSVIKSHTHPSAFPKVFVRFSQELGAFTAPPILVVREPKDVAVSFFFYHFFHMRMYYGSVFDRLPTGLRLTLRKTLFFKSFVLKVAQQWRDFHEGWGGMQYELVRYEDLKKDVYQTMYSLIHRLSGSVSEQYLREAIEYCSFENLQKMEVDFVKPSSRHDCFFREGKTGGWVQHFSAELAKQYDEIVGPIASKFGY